MCKYKYTFFSSYFYFKIITHFAIRQIFSVNSFIRSYRYWHNYRILDKFNNFGKKRDEKTLKSNFMLVQKVNNMPRKTKLTSLGVVHKLL